MYPSPAPSPSPSPGPTYLYHQSQQQQQQQQQHGSNGAGANPYNNNVNGTNGSSGSAYPSVGRFPSSGVNWVSRSHHPHAAHQQNPSLSSLPGTMNHVGANSGNLNAPSSPGFGALGVNNNNHHLLHHHHNTHGPSGLSQIPSPSPLHAMNNNSAAAAASAAAVANASPHWQQQLLKAEVSRISLQVKCVSKS